MSPDAFEVELVDTRLIPERVNIWLRKSLAKLNSGNPPVEALSGSLITVVFTAGRRTQIKHVRKRTIQFGCNVSD